MVVTDYREFIARKNVRNNHVGFDVDDAAINQRAFDWQRVIVKWALKTGRAALLEECGLGKTLQQLLWSEHVVNHSGCRALLLCPLVVQFQTKAEANRFGINVPVNICESQADVTDGITIANYEKLHLFDASHFRAVCLDEGSILKNFTGSTKRALCRDFRDTRYKLTCTATPAPNDRMEIGNQAEFLGVMPSNEMLARWFVNDGSKVGSYRLKKHGERDFWRWMASWAVCISSPSDIGFECPGYDLPPLEMIEHVVKSPTPKGQLFANVADSISAVDVHREKRAALSERADVVGELVTSDRDQWAVWCDTDYEADALLARIPDAVEARGSQPIELKQERLRAFTEGQARVIITKPEIGGLGLNWQHCHKTTWFAGYSFERWYQAIRRLLRFGQEFPVECHVVRTEREGSIVEAVQEKERLHKEMQSEMAGMMREAMLSELGLREELERYVTTQTLTLPNWITKKGKR